MFTDKWTMLQLFADGTGDGGAASATGDNGDAAGHQRLQELGVPASKLRNRSYKLPTKAAAPAVPSESAPQAEAPQVDAAEAPTEGKRMTWDEIMADPEYNEQMQKTMKARLKTAGAAEENLGKLGSVLPTLAKYYGLDAENLDHAALAEAIGKDDRFIEERAMQNGVDPEVQRKLDEYDALKAQREQQQQQTIQQQMLQQHFMKLEQQAAAMKNIYPGFDLRTEMQNPKFARLVAPNSPISVEDAYFAVHRQELQQRDKQIAAQQTAMQISNAIRSNTMHPSENGTSSQAPSVTRFDYSKASPKERAAFKQKLREAQARGEKVYPGQF